MLPLNSVACSHFFPAGRVVPIAATHIYQMSFFTGFGVSAVVYCGLNYAFPAAGAHRVFEEVDLASNETTSETADTKSFEKDDFATNVYPVS